MSEIYKVFDDSGLTALTNHMKVTRTKANSNEAAIETLGEDLAGLSEEVVTALGNKQDKLTFDSTPTSGSVNPVTSGGVKTYADNNFAAKTHGHDFSELTVNDPEAAKTALAIENGMVLKNIALEAPFSFGIYARVIYGNGKFVAISGSSGGYTNIAYSFDGITWTIVNMPVSVQWRSVTYGDGMFVAVAYSSDIAAYSTDGITWTQTTMPVKSTWHSVTYGDGTFVAISGGNNMRSDIAAYSTDGITWTQTAMPTSTTWGSVTYGNGMFVAVNYYVSDSMSTAAYSTDGITWSKVNGYILVSHINSITYGNDKFVVVGRNETAYSTDGITWTKLNLPITTYCRDVTYACDKFVVGYETGILYSFDGITWTESTCPAQNDIKTIAYGNGKFVAATYNPSTIIYSYDGITWKDSVQYISQNGEDVTADTLIVLDHTHDEYALADHTHDEVPEHEHLFNRGVTTEGDGAAYTATVEGITALTAGLSFIMIPHTASTSQTATLNVNGLGAKQLRRPLSSNNTTTVANSVTNWLYAGKPVRVMYNGSFWIVMDMPRPHATDLYGTVPVENLPDEVVKNGATSFTLTSPNGTVFTIAVNDDGQLLVT